jgi:hypothetical protein
MTNESSKPTTLAPTVATPELVPATPVVEKPAAVDKPAVEIVPPAKH